MVPPQTVQDPGASSMETTIPAVERMGCCHAARISANCCFNAARVESETAPFSNPLTVEDALDLDNGDGDPSRQQPRVHVRGVEPDYRPVDELGQHLDDGGQVEILVLPRDDSLWTGPRAAPRVLLGRKLEVGTDIKKESLERLATELLPSNKVQQDAVDSKTEPRLQLRLRVSCGGGLHHPKHRLPERYIPR